MHPLLRRRPTLTGAALATAVMLPATVALAAGAALAVEEPVRHSAPDPALTLDPIGTYRTGQFDVSAAEIVAFDPGTDRTFVVNAESGRLDVLDAADPTEPTLVESLAVAGVRSGDGSTVPEGATVNSLDVRDDGLVVLAVESPTKTDPGWLVFSDARSLDLLGAVRVGALPDMVTLTPDGDRAVVANEGEPNDAFTVDPEGSVGVVDLPSAVSAPAQSAVRTADFHDFEAGGSKTLPEDVRVFGPHVGEGLRVSRNLEPEYVAVDGSGDVAYAALQEANAVAVVDLATAEVTEIWSLGFKDHSVAGAGLDPSDRDGAVAIGAWPVKGIYLPDGMHSYVAGGETYLVTANEGDAREWGSYVEGARVKDLGKGAIRPICSDSPLSGLRGDAALGRLNVTTANGLDPVRNCYDELYSFGGRSFSIWTTDGEQVFDSGDAFERITALADPAHFNSNHTESTLEGRSDDKGPEPENVAIGRVGDSTYAFIGFERVGGIAVYDITTPADSRFVTYVNNRDFSVSVGDADDPAAVLDAAGDLGPEGIDFVAAEDSPTGKALVAVGNEVSGTTTFLEVTSEFDATPAPVISGEPVVGNELTAEVEAWTPSAEFAYRWQRDGEAIAGSTERTYTAVPADAGAELTVEVTGTASGVTPVTRTSEPVVVERGDEDTLVLELDEGEVEVGGTVTGTVTGVAAEEEVALTLFSDPVDLGTLTADDDGEATLEVTLPDDVEPGEHTLVAEGLSGTDDATLTVLGDDGAGGTGDDDTEVGGGGGLLPDAGAPLALAAIVAALAAVVGGALLARRRSA